MAQLINRSHNLASCPLYKIELRDFSPEAIIESGQTFRFNQVQPDLFEVLAGSRRLFFHRTDENHYTFYCTRREFDDFWRGYFDLDQDYELYNRQIAEDDQFLLDAAEYCKGLKILRQEPWEMLITFLLAQRKNLKSIKNSIQKLCVLCGSVLQDCAGSYYAFPTPDQIASLSLEQLESCGLGYRAPYVESAAQAVHTGAFKLSEIKNLDNRSAVERLKTLPGIGDKIAECVLLFGYHRLDTFPVDIWIERVQEDFYDGAFPTDNYTGINGVLQQYLFHYARNHYYKEKEKNE